MGADAHQILGELVEELGETANLAILVGDQAQYVAQVPSRNMMRTFTEVGRRVDLYSTGVGKALLAQLGDEAARSAIRNCGFAPLTRYTITTAPALFEELRAIRERGYALDEQEQELGVRCVAVTIPTPELADIAMSISGPITRLTDDMVARAVPLLHSCAERLAAQIGHGLRAQ
ncbi:IclR family transcriptional regulator [Mycobacterium sp. NAZ190054]|uniref:IclR family transcriptional regulator n=1 Tax=Mycobacterium sp. NAZ190054 TaxID=1747766 RepID=UPI001E2E5EF7|nr:IclR family transcriptional regulator [Mycobacterium sp. NAZ190054]